MRLVYFCSQFPLISETFVIHEINDVMQSVEDLSILSLTEPVSPHKSTLPAQLGYDDRISYRPLLKDSSIARKLRTLSLMMKLLGRGNLQALLKIITDGRTSAEYSRYILMETAEAIYHAGDPDLIHCHFGPNGRLAAILKHYNLVRGKVTTTFHGYDVSTYLQQKPQNYYDVLFKHGDLFLCVNHNYLMAIRALGAPAERSYLFHIGVDCNSFPYHPRKYDPKQPLHFICIARMTEKKGHTYLIESYNRLVKSHPDLPVHLDLIGDGPLFSQIVNMVDSKGLHDKVTLHGALQHDQVKKHLSAAHIFVLPSVTASDGDMEGIPVVLMEAMAQGLPVISTVHSGIPELIENGVSGLLAEEKNAEELYEKMAFLALHPKKWRKMTDAARAKIEKDFNRQIQTDVLLNAFNRLLA
jgi:colanic acid/amylovoran biosynthesis glycosyltransferase